MRKYFILFLALPLLISGCAKKDTRDISLSEAHEKFALKCKANFDYDLTLTAARNALWIYLPVKEAIVDLEKKKKIQKAKAQPQDKYVIKYLKTKFEGETILLDYTSGITNYYPKFYGYLPFTTDYYRETALNVLGTLTKVLTEKKDRPGFIVLVVTDIKKGVVIQSTVMYSDILTALSAKKITEDELFKRMAIDISENKNFIDNLTGDNMYHEPVKFTKFVTGTISNRILYNFNKLTLSSKAVVEDEIIKSVAISVYNNNFGQFRFLVLNNIKANEIKTLKKKEVLEVIDRLKREAK